MVHPVLVKVRAQSCHLDRDHEHERVRQTESDAGHAMEDVDDFGVVVYDIAVGVVAWPCDELVGFDQDVGTDTDLRVSHSCGRLVVW